MISGIASTVIHAPSVNLAARITASASTVVTAPTALSARRDRLRPPCARQCATMPI